MKNKIWVFLVVLGIVFSGCGSEDTGNNMPEILKVSLLGSVNGPGGDAWEPKEGINEMTMVKEGVYEKEVVISTFIPDWIKEDVENANYAFKFAANRAWANNEGTAGVEYGAEKIMN